MTFTNTFSSRKKVWFFLALALLAVTGTHGQAVVKGTVKSSDYREGIAGATLFDVADTRGAVSSDEKGNFLLSSAPGRHTFVCSFIGMRSDTFTVQLSSGDTLIRHILMENEMKMLDVVVVSAGKYEQKLEDLTVSMEVIRPALLESKNATNISTALNQVPGVTMLDGEPQIRSGSGFSFGVGSRVGVLVDDIPVLVGDQGRPEWSFIPMENIEQIEVVKGAASVLYGSSALSGIINVRTTYPKEKPETKAEMYYGQYDMPSEAGTKWWSGAAPLYGFSFLHSERMGKKDNLDVVIGGRGLQDHNYIGPARPVKFIQVPVDTSESDRNVATRLGRFNFGLRYRPETIKGLAYGVNGNFMMSHDNFTLIWLNDSSGLYRAFPGTMTVSDSKMFYVDPFLTYFSPGGLKHVLHGRVFRNDVQSTNSQSTASTVYFGEYRIYKEFSSMDTLRFTGGLVTNNIRSHAELYSASGHPDNQLDNYAAFVQLDKKFGNALNISGGFRGEYYAINKEESVLKPVVRGGLSLALTRGTFLRASYGQGYRYPTITEKYIFTSVGGISVFPNTDLKPETSNSAELGLKQGFKIRKFYGFIDASLFEENYSNTIEYTYALWRPDSSGFKFVNTGNTRVRGYEFSIAGSGKLTKNLALTIWGGYTYTLPQSVQRDYVYAVDNPSPGFTPTQLSYLSTSSDTTDNILKYRFRRSAKGDIELTWKFITLGASVTYYSFMDNIDKVFYDIDVPYRLPTGIKKYREEHHKGTTVVDARLRLRMNSNFTVALLANNATNLSYSLRPLKIEAPRMLSFQVAAKF